MPEIGALFAVHLRSPNDLRRAILALVEMSAETRMQIARDSIKQALTWHPKIISSMLGAVYDELLGFTDRGELISLQAQRPVGIDKVTIQSRVPSILRFIFKSETMATRTSKPATEVLSNEQLALELAKAILVGSVRAGIPDDLILNNVKDANKLTLEKVRLDGAYAALLYADILGRLDKQSAKKS